MLPCRSRVVTPTLPPKIINSVNETPGSVTVPLSVEIFFAFVIHLFRFSNHSLSFSLRTRNGLGAVLLHPIPS